MKLNCDLGEGYGQWRSGPDAELMPLLDEANIACGFHAGDPLVMEQTIALATAHNVSIGAHPGYPDLQGFGRRSMRLQEAELRTLLHYQISALDGMAAAQGGMVEYVKPHGALYNDMMASSALRDVIFASIAGFSRLLPLVVQATPERSALEQQARQYGITLRFEAFIDRRYLADGSLQPRSQQGAVLNAKQSIEQARQIIQCGMVNVAGGGQMPLAADTLCLHGDSPDALAVGKQVRRLISENKQH